MRGLAQTLFIEKEKRLPWKGPERHVQPHAWPFLENALKAKRLNYADYALAERLLRREPQPNEDLAALICHASLAARSGHLCILVNEKIQPELQQLWRDSAAETTDLSAAELNTLETLIRSGLRRMPDWMVSEVSTEQSLIPLTPLCRSNGRIYLQRNWVYESLFIRHWHRIEKMQPTLEVHEDKLVKQLLELQQQKRLLPEQADAIRQTARQSLTIITGGPGTGKTYTAGWLIKLFWENLTPEQQARCEIALAAPTGKAASNLQSALKKALGNLEINVPAAKTLHSLLGIKTSHNKVVEAKPIQLSADLVLVDESSMIDVRLMAQLFAAIKPGARLILLGDRYQLPSVEAGGLFSDLITHKEGKIGELRTCLRAELKEIVDLAQKINQGNIEETLQFLANNQTAGVQRLNFDGEDDTVKSIHRQIISHCEPLFPQNIHADAPPTQLLEEFNRFRILTPLRQGPYGVDEINRLFLSQSLKKMAKGSWFIAPIMIVRNDHRLGLLNGETGVLLARSKGNEYTDSYFLEGDFALFPSTGNEDPVRKISALMLPKFEYAYCLSVHKSQGSEFERILLLNPKGSEAFGREVLYTAVTRARKQIEVWSTDEILSATIAKKSHRLSGLIA